MMDKMWDRSMKDSSNNQDSVGTATMPLLLPAAGVGKMLGVSTRTVWNMHQDGQLGPLPIHLRGATRWKFAEIEAWVQADCPNRERWLTIHKGR